MTEASLVYEVKSAGLGVEFLDDVQRVVDHLRTFPKLGQSIAGGFRRALLRRFPFLLIYADQPESILIIAVAHQRREPDYWRERTIP